MKKQIFISLVALLLVLASACSKKPYFVSPNFKQTTKTHQQVAVLPVKMIFTGKPMGLLEEEDIESLEEGESQAFQMSLFNQLLYSTNSGKKGMYVSIQPVEITNKKLAEKNISVRESWDMLPTELADALGVDAVIKTQVSKQRYLTDLAAYGIDIGQKVLLLLTKGKSFLTLGGKNLDKTSDMNAKCSLYNSNTGEVLWSMGLTETTEWNKPSEEAIDDMNQRFAKNFPYRGKRKK